MSVNEPGRFQSHAASAVADQQTSPAPATITVATKATGVVTRDTMVMPSSTTKSRRAQPFPPGASEQEIYVHQSSRPPTFSVQPGLTCLSPFVWSGRQPDVSCAGRYPKPSFGKSGVSPP